MEPTASEMTLVEGVGDEVTQFLLVLLVVLLGLAAWWSTRIADTPLVRTVLILERRTRQRGAGERHRSRQRSALEIEGTTNGNTTVVRTVEALESDIGQVEENSTVTEGASSDETKTEADSSTAAPTPHPAPQSQEEDPECLLRRRRLAFLENMANPAQPSTERAETEEEEEEDSGEADSGPGSIRIRLKYLNDEQKLVEGRLQEPLGDFRRRHFSLELGANKLVRLIFNGQVLARDGASLEEHGLFDNCVVHCLVHQPRVTEPHIPVTQTHPNQPREGARQEVAREWDLGSVVFMFLSVVLGLAWYGRCVYCQYFTTTASVALVGLTGVFVVSVVGLMLPDQDGLRQ